MSRPALKTKAEMLPLPIAAALHAQCYDSFKNHLRTAGFTVYPKEFDCVYSRHPLVDVAARMGSHYWAFEYKSESDSISRGVEQLRCYAEWFDYVVLVSERMVDHRSSENYWRLKDIGAGIWVYDPTSLKLVEKIYPYLQQPDRMARRFVSRRFDQMIRRLSSAPRVPSSPSLPSVASHPPPFPAHLGASSTHQTRLFDS